jgi:hypothetical protein
MLMQVQFKNTCRYFVLSSGISPQSINIGDFVKVEADRGEDLGVITEVLAMQSFLDMRMQNRIQFSMDDDSGNVRRILRVASMQERQTLVTKFQDEENILQVCLPSRVISRSMLTYLSVLMLFWKTSVIRDILAYVCVLPQAMNPL